MAILENVSAAKAMSADEKQARLDALFAKRDTAIAAGLEIWSIDRINEEIRKGRDRTES